MLRNVITKLQSCSYQALTFSTKAVTEQTSPIISKRSYPDENFLYQNPREVWLENLDTVQRKKLGLVRLHPHVFGASPRIDIIHQNVQWQRMYRFVVSIIIHLLPSLMLYESKSITQMQQIFRFSPMRIQRPVQK